VFIHSLITVNHAVYDSLVMQLLSILHTNRSK
jgi:hypothetical protein